MIVLDTNIIIDHIQDDPEVSRWVKHQIENGENFVISSLTVIELFSYPKSTPEELSAIEHLLQELSLIEVNLTVARESARVRKECGITLVDATIAATALLWNCPLATRDRAFKKIPDLVLLPV